MSTRTYHDPLHFAVAILLVTSPGMVTSALPQVDDCLDYSTHDHWLPNPHGTSSTPSKVVEWNNNLVILRPEGLELIGLDDPQIPAAVGRIVGDFSDFALGPDFVVLGSAGRLQGFDLPSLTPRFTYQNASTATPRLACRDSLVVAAFGRHLELFTNSVPSDLAPVGAYDVPQYYSDIGLGSLQISGEYILGCAGGGNNMAGYYAALTVVDITDPALPFMSDCVTFAPGDPDSSSTLFFEAKPHGPGFVVSGLIFGDIKPEVADDNAQFLARMTIDGGHIAWHGLVFTGGPMTCGFVIDGDTALWTVGSAYENGWGSDYLVNLDWNLSAPTRGYAASHFRPGRMCWVRGRSTLASGPGLYHMESLRAAASTGWIGRTSPNARHVRAVDNQFVVRWREWSDTWSCGWDIRTYDFTTTPATPVDVCYGFGYDFQWRHLDSCAAMGRHVYFDVEGTSYRVDIDANGMLSEPVVTAAHHIQCAIPWDDHFVVATKDSLKVCSVGDAGELTDIAAVALASTRDVELVRIGDLLLVKRTPFSSLRNIGYVYHFDLSDISHPRYLLTSGGLQGPGAWLSYLHYVPEAGLLFDFGEGALRWHRLDALGRPTLAGSWTTPFPGIIWDIRLHGDTLYLALGGGGLGVFRFDPVQGLTPIGGQLGIQPAWMLPTEDGRLLIAPDLLTLTLDCSDPLPVFASAFRADRDPYGVHLSWQCDALESQAGQFEVWRQGAEPERLIGRQPAIPGAHEMRDDSTGVQNAHTYNLYLAGVPGQRTLLDSIEVSAGSGRHVDLRATAAPNPFNASTTITFDLPTEGPARLSIYDMAGRRLRTLFEERMPQGRHEAAWDGRDASGRDLGSGTYLARLQFGNEAMTLRIGLLR